MVPVKQVNDVETTLPPSGIKGDSRFPPIYALVSNEQSCLNDFAEKFKGNYQMITLSWLGIHGAAARKRKRGIVQSCCTTSKIACGGKLFRSRVPCTDRPFKYRGR
jgi:hypothetical protein